MINKVILVGRLGQDPDYKVLDSGASVAKFSIATDEHYKDASGEWQKKTEWTNIIGWRLLAERTKNQFKKGTLVYVEGKLTTRKYIKNDETRYVTEVVANVLRTLKDGIPREGHMPGEDDAPAPYQPSAKQPTAAATMGEDAGAMVGSDGEDLPF
ncbi:MAG: single-stranded DNA-binding protein [Bacteroidota bacterium]